jgi:hypothetical protein
MPDDPSPPVASYHFFSYLRRGFCSQIAPVDTFGSAQPSVAQPAVGVLVAGKPLLRTVTLNGPGDVNGLAANQVVRTDPVHGAVGVEPNYFALVEFDAPDLPWICTPAAPAGERLRPWIVLVVVDADGAAAPILAPATPLPVLHVPGAAVATLPDLAESWCWAHAQVTVPAGTAPESAFADGADPRLAISRLMCPRHLEPNRSYLAAVVPAFEVGRKAGLGLPLGPADETRLEPAWQAASAEPAPLSLPVYYSWTFRTGEGADFEYLARQLHGGPMPPGLGTRSLDVSRPGAGLPSGTPPASVDDPLSIVWLGGALAPPDAPPKPARDGAAEDEFKASLAELLNTPAALLEQAQPDPVVAPPIYGGRHAFAARVSDAAPPWLLELNLDPCNRVAAGLGTRVIQHNQEAYMARAWRQLGDVLAANRLLRSAQLARGGSRQLHERLASADAASLLRMSYPAHRRIANVAMDPAQPHPDQTLSRSITLSCLPDVAVEPAFQRIACRAPGFAGLVAPVVARFAAAPFAAPAANLNGCTAMRPALQVIGEARSGAVLGNLYRPWWAHPQWLDAMLEALAAFKSTAMTPSPTMPTRGDVNPLPVLLGLGAARAYDIEAVLAAALPPEAGQPGTGGAELQDGRVVLTGEMARAAAWYAGALHAIDDTAWAVFEGDHPSALTPQAGMFSETLSRLDALRRDPAGLAALAGVANGALDDELLLLDASVTRGRSGGMPSVYADLSQGQFVPRPMPRGWVGWPPPDEADRQAADELVAAAAAALQRAVTAADAEEPPPPPPLNLDQVKRGLLDRIDPAHTVPARVMARIDDYNVLREVRGDDPLGLVMACPRFNDPMWQALYELPDEWQRSADGGWLLPGLGLLPPNTATLAQTNPGFVAAYLVGLNHEMMRELLWRGYPTDQLGTPFCRFWGRLGNGGDEIGPLHLANGALAAMLAGGVEDLAVFVLRSELVRRYPGMLAYLCRAARDAGGAPRLLDEGDASVRLLPAFRHELPPDILLAGFAISPAAIRAAPDPWYLVLVPPPGAPRFGLDIADANTPAVPAHARELAWSHMAPDSQPGAQVRFAIADPPLLRGVRIDEASWGASAATLAMLTYQNPVRVAIRAIELMPPAGA